MKSQRKLTPEQIRAAIEAGNRRTRVYVVASTETQADKRKGRIHGWKVTGEYLGQFRTHEKALEHGANVTKLGNVWFVWEEQK